MSRLNLWARRLMAGAALTLMATAASAEPVAIVGARILTAGPAGEIANGAVVFDNGRIIAVGPSVTPPAGARIIDGTGKVVSPGLIAAGTTLGLSEISSVGGTNDARTNGRAITAAFDVSYGLNPASGPIPVARQGGITRAVATPGYGGGEDGEGDAGAGNRLFAGQAALIALSQDDLQPRPRVAMVLDFGEDGAARGGGSRGAERIEVESLLDEVRFYQRHRAAYDAGQLRALDLGREDLEALGPAIDGRQLLLIGVSRASDIREVLDLAKVRRLKIALTGAEEAWMVADEIAAAGVPVILNPTANLPARFESLGATLRNAALLQAAGVRVAFTGNDSAHRVRELRYNAGIAVARGLPYAAGIEAITINPARIFGVDRELGSIEPGKLADLVVWDGDPLEPLSQAEAVFIAGAQQPLDTARPLQLRDKYVSPLRDQPGIGQ